MAFDLDDEELRATRKLVCNKININIKKKEVSNLERLINCGYLDLPNNVLEEIKILIERDKKLKKVEKIIETKNISIETLLDEFERLENLEDDIEHLIYKLEDTLGFTKTGRNIVAEAQSKVLERILKNIKNIVRDN